MAVYQQFVYDTSSCNLHHINRSTHKFVLHTVTEMLESVRGLSCALKLCGARLAENNVNKCEEVGKYT